VTHSRQVDVPIYAFQTDLSEGRVLRGARALVERAQTTRSKSMLIDGAPVQSHLDPLIAAPKGNRFLRSVVRFLNEN
jgi:hypothetical protein